MSSSSIAPRPRTFSTRLRVSAAPSTTPHYRPSRAALSALVGASELLRNVMPHDVPYMRSDTTAAVVRRPQRQRSFGGVREPSVTWRTSSPTLARRRRESTRQALNVLGWIALLEAVMLGDGG